MLPTVYFVALVISSLTIKPSGMPSAVGISKVRTLDNDGATGRIVEKQARKIVAQALKILL